MYLKIINLCIDQNKMIQTFVECSLLSVDQVLQSVEFCETGSIHKNMGKVVTVWDLVLKKLLATDPLIQD